MLPLATYHRLSNVALDVDSPIWPNRKREQGIATHEHPVAPRLSTVADFKQSLGQFESKIYEYSSSLQRLRVIKRLYGTDTRVSEEFALRRSQYRFEAPQSMFRDQFEAIFADIDKTVGGVFSEGLIYKFLDLGCAPGGFSKYILDHNPDAQGLGITLSHIPVSLHGTSLADTDRYNVREGDLTELNFDTGSSKSKYIPPSARSKQLDPQGYGLIIAGAFATGLGGYATPASRATLALSQLGAILSTLQPRGTSVIVATTKPFLWNVEIFAVLRQVFDRIVPAKHSRLHAIRSSCYFVCIGFRKDVADKLSLGKKVKCALDRLKELDENEVTLNVSHLSSIVTCTRSLTSL